MSDARAVEARLAPAAEKELSEGFEFYRRVGTPALGEAFLSEVTHAITLLAAQPSLGTSLRGTICRFSLRRFPYDIVSRPRATELRVLAIAHQRRRPGYWSGRS